MIEVLPNDLTSYTLRQRQLKIGELVVALDYIEYPDGSKYWSANGSCHFVKGTTELYHQHAADIARYALCDSGISKQPVWLEWIDGPLLEVSENRV